MTIAVDDPLAGLGPRVERALVDWLPAQRWFAGKQRSIDRVELVRSAVLLDRRDESGPAGVLTIVAVESGGAVEHYLIPLGMRRFFHPAGPALVLCHEGMSVYDGTIDAEINAELLRLIGADSTRQGVRFRAEAGLPGELSQPLPSRRSGAEQSNTSIVYGDRFILKLFRRVTLGVNPDLELPRLLHGAGNQRVAPVFGSVEAELAGQPVTLGVLQEFVPDAADGWTLANQDLRRLLEMPDYTHERSERTATELGHAVADVHADLDRHLGSVVASPPDLVRVSEGMLSRLHAATLTVPDLAAHAPALRTAFTAVASRSKPVRLQRVHGDLHLGQVLRNGRAWLLIDFEGEPSAPLAERTAWQPALKDVAGMLRSFDYAAESLAQRSDSGDRAQRWVERMTGAFLSGYAERSGTDLARDNALLTAFQLDKAVYETVYEARNRPDWVDIPMRAVRKLLENR